MQALWGRGAKDTYGGVEYWHTPERCGWLQKQGVICVGLLVLAGKLAEALPNLCLGPVALTGEYIKTWRRRWA